MTTIYFTTVVRAGELARAGELVVLDWSTKRVLATAPLAPRDAPDLDNNPRGGRRGGRGIWVTPDLIYAATNDAIECFDHALTPRGALSNGLLAGLHEVHMRTPGRLWVAATTIDAAVEVDLETGDSTGVYWPRGDVRFQRQLNLVPSDFDQTSDLRLVAQLTDFARSPGHLHLNAVATWRDDLHALFSKQGVIANLEKGEVVMRHPLLVRAHNLVVVGDDVFVCSTKARHICQFNLVSGQLVRSLDLRKLNGIPELTGLSESALMTLGTEPPVATTSGAEPPVVALGLFARGLQVVDDLVFAGVSPGSVLCIDWARGWLVDSFQYSDQRKTAIHGLLVE
jgi:hypothetical protein